MPNFSYNLTYANVPFTTDKSVVFNLDSKAFDTSPTPATSSPLKDHSRSELVEEIDNLAPFQYYQDFSTVLTYPGRNLGAIAHIWNMRQNPGPTIKLFNWYYPTSASRWSVFRGLATSSQVKAMVQNSSGGSLARTFLMSNTPQGAYNLQKSHSLNSQLYFLPAKPLGEGSLLIDGLYLVTLVDERYYWQNTPVSLKIDRNTNWSDLIDSIASQLGVTINYSAISSNYNKPEIDSQLWTNLENAGIVLDSIAYNIGRVVVRNLGGTYNLYTPEESNNLVNSNRGNANYVVNLGGGNYFNDGSRTKAGDLTTDRNSIIPKKVYVTFPKYVEGDNPVPHLLNSRYKNQRPSTWYEESYGEVYTVEVPISSGGSTVANLTGTGYKTFHSTAKALISGETSVTPSNIDGLTTLATQIAKDYYNAQSITALDEIYPGTVAWSPEGIHDLIWVFSSQQKQAALHVFRSAWNNSVWEMQQSTPVLSGFSTVPRGIGGPSVAQTIRDSFSGNIQTQIKASGISQSCFMGSGDLIALFENVGCFPTQNRWKGKIDDEVILFEGTSGGIRFPPHISGCFEVDIAYRAIDGTNPALHNSGAYLTQIVPDNCYGVNLSTYEKMGFVYPSDWTSGGIQGVNIIPQIQTVEILSDEPATINSINHYSGRIKIYDSTLTGDSQYVDADYIWIVDRNENPVVLDKKYEGQFAGYNDNLDYTLNSVKPVYLINSTEGDCDDVFLEETDIRCEDGLQNLYRRDVKLLIVDNCITREYDDWYYLRTEGCCDCGSGDGGGSGSSGSDCVPGVCGACLNPPSVWNLFINGFQGNCGVFNRLWTLVNQTECIWYGSYSSGNLVVSVTLLVTNGTNASRLTLQYGEFSAVYRATIIDCCAIAVFSLLDGSCICDNIDTPPPNCINCDITPSYWEFTFAGGTRSLVLANGNYKLGGGSSELPGGLNCTWQATGGDAGNGYGNVLITALDITVAISTSSGQAVYKGNNLNRNCCQPVTMSLISIDDNGNGSQAPLTITMVPSCSNQVQLPLCPSSIAAVPTCCSSGSSGSSGSGGSGGSGGSSGSDDISVNCCSCTVLPRQWSLSVAGITSAGTCGDACLLLNGNWTLTYRSGCTWDTNDTGSCPGCASPSWSLSCSLGVWTLVPCLSTGSDMYTIVSFNCLSSNTFTYSVGEISDCANFPANLIITPV